MESLLSALDLDKNLEIPVTIGGRVFKLTQQSWPALKRISMFVQTEGESEGVVHSEDDDRAVAMMTNFEASVPIVALMFGYDQQDTTTEEIVAFLKNHLTPQKTLKIFNAWWKLNEMDDFFDRGGKILLHPELAAIIQAQKPKIAEMIAATE